MMLDRQEHFVATFHDMTESKRLQQAQGQNTLLSLLTSSVSHEMVTPLRCIISFANNLQDELKHSERRKDAELILVTSKLLLQQVKLLLDQSMIENEMFVPQYEEMPLNRIVQDAVQILSG